MNRNLYNNINTFKMKFKFLVITAFFLASITNAQSSLVGAESFSVNLPAGYSRAVGTNDYATVQWQNEEMHSYGFVIIENLDELKISGVSSDLQSYMDICISNYSGFPQFKSFAPKLFKNKKGQENFQKQISYYNEELESTVYLQFNIFKSKNFIYQIVNFGNEDFLKVSKENTDYIINNVVLPQ